MTIIYGEPLRISVEDLQLLGEVRVLHLRLQEANLDTGVTLHLPPTVLHGVESLWGLPVFRSDGPPALALPLAPA